MSAPSRYGTRSQTQPPPARSDDPTATRPPDASQTRATTAEPVRAIHDLPHPAALISDSQPPLTNKPDAPVTDENVERFLAVEANKANPAYRLVEYLLARSRQPAETSQLQALEKGLATLAQKVDSLAKANPQRSYAAAAATAGNAPNLTHAAPPALTALRQSQAHRESIVCAKSTTAEVAQMTSIQLVRAINTQQGRDTAKAARRLGAIGGSNRWAITFSSAETKAAAEQNPSWCQKVFGPTATIYHHQYKVVSHGFNLGVVRGLGPDRLLQQLSSDNDRIRFTAAGPLKGHETKDRGPLVFSVDDVEQANVICRKGVFFEAQWHPCVPFCGDAQVPSPRNRTGPSMLPVPRRPPCLEQDVPWMGSCGRCSARGVRAPADRVP
ncbi:hypothetical protein SEPCBS57363_006253 [Sporothrix epigloea]|uniref:Uncharacterized protein n=1 Tax=Sporothrix epigloea TaxID=1892477 RepID=A0ABP0E2F3_9PEZI